MLGPDALRPDLQQPRLGGHGPARPTSALMMFLFGVGTLPAMLATSFGAQGCRDSCAAAAA